MAMTKVGATASDKAGLPPGTMVLVGTAAEATAISLVTYDPDRIDIHESSSVEDVRSARQATGVTWVDVTGLADVNVVEGIGRAFGLHPLTLEDIVHLGQRPKVEFFDTYIFITVKALHQAGDGPVEAEQISTIVGDGFLLTFRERKSGILAPLRERIVKSKGRVRSAGADYLAFAILDTVVDHYFAVVERFEDRHDAIEDRVLAESEDEIGDEIHGLRADLLHLRRLVAPVRDVVAALGREGGRLIRAETLPYLGDLHDHVLRVRESLEYLRESASGLRELHLTNVNNRMNAVMKALTVVATIFIPLTFLVGVYGMNFAYMPELKWPWAYPVLWGVMIAMGASLAIYFKRKGWF